VETWLPVIGGLVLLSLGGELLVRGAVRVARRLGVSPLVIGLTLVGFGTSTPELVASVQAALSGSPGIAYGNIVGSNIANILLVLGASALLSPIFVASRTLRRDGLVMIAAVAAFAGIAAVTMMGRLAGAVFVAALAAYTLVALRQERTAPDDHGAIYQKGAALSTADAALSVADRPAGPIATALLTAAIGLALVLLGGYLLVGGAISLARSFDISETVIGLTIVAVGTSLPELVTSLIAALRRGGDVAFGNIVGSCIYNVLGIAGMTALIAPARVPAELVAFDNLVMIGVCVLAAVLAYTGRRIGRREGGLLLAGYVAYLAWLWP
jgi:cation:H+ antiporter